jgi:tRNA A-37 threonylcarbamoyl transferase component Bud32
VLKVVISEQKSEKTKEEFNRLLIAYRIIPSSVVEVIDGSFKSGYINVGSSGYLMNSVGTPLRSDELKAAERTKICCSLNALHCNGIFHGDARVPNAVNFGGNFKWIDFHDTIPASTETAAIYDVKTLMGSMFLEYAYGIRSEDFQQLLDAYGKSIGEFCATKARDPTLKCMRDILEFHL